MHAALLVARATLALVFGVAAVGKLADLRGSQKAMRDFGLPDSLAAALGVFLPCLELAVAVALIPASSARVAALVAAVLLAAFGTAIAKALVAGRQPECHCFGQFHSTPAGWPALARDVALGAVALFVVVAGSGGSFGALGDISTTGVIGIGAGLTITVVVAAALWVCLNVMRGYGEVLNRLEVIETAVGLAPAFAASSSASHLHGRHAAGLPLGARAPAFSLPQTGGGSLDLPSLLGRGLDSLLVFSDPECGPCQALLPQIGAWQREHSGRLTVAVVGRGDLEANRRAAVAHGLRDVLVQRDREVAESYGALGTPAAVVVTTEGVIASELAVGSDAIRELLTRAVTGALTRPPVPIGPSADHDRIGQPAHARLRDLAGRPREVAQRGHETLVVFWNPSCGFCAEMLEDLRDMESHLGPTRLVVVSSGSPEEILALNLRATILLDEEFALGRAWGAPGTPAAVRLDAGGRFATPVLSGRDAILTLSGVAADRPSRSLQPI